MRQPEHNVTPHHQGADHDDTRGTYTPTIEESVACAEERRILAAALGLTESQARTLNISEDAYGPDDLRQDIETMKRLGYWKEA